MRDSERECERVRERESERESERVRVRECERERERERKRERRVNGTHSGKLRVPVVNRMDGRERTVRGSRGRDNNFF